MAAAGGPIDASPAPREGSAGRSSSTTSTGGTSLNVRIGYSSHVRLVTVRASKRTCSFLVQLSACRAPPSIWLTTPSGFSTRPPSTAIVSRRTRTDASASTSATTAHHAPRFLYRATPTPSPASAPGARPHPARPRGPPGPAPPAGPLGRRPQHRARPLVGQHPQPVLDRVDVRPGRELVDH